MAGDAEWMKLGEDGKQPFMSTRLTPQELLTKLKASKAKRHSSFTVSIKPKCGGLCALECKCGARAELLAAQGRQGVPQAGPCSQQAAVSAHHYRCS